MPVRTSRITRGKNKGKYNVRSKGSGKKHNKKPMSKAKAKRMVTAINISMGYVPGKKRRRK